MKTNLDGVVYFLRKLAEMRRRYKGASAENIPLRESESLIAKQALEIDRLNQEVQSYRNGVKRVRALIYCVGGPLNDNVKRYTKEQMADWQRVINSLPGPTES